jgi:hypothetical protein
MKRKYVNEQSAFERADNFLKRMDSKYSLNAGSQTPTSKELPATTTPPAKYTRQDLDKMINLGCFKNIKGFSLDTTPVRSSRDGKNFLIYGKNDKGEIGGFFDDGTIRNFVTSATTGNWTAERYCPAFTEKLGQGGSTATLTNKQISILDDIITQDKRYFKEVPQGDSASNYEQVDVTKIINDNPKFKTSYSNSFQEGQTFLYIKKGKSQATEFDATQTKILTNIEKYGWKGMDCQTARAFPDEYYAPIDLSKDSEMMKKYFNTDYTYYFKDSYCVAKAKPALDQTDFNKFLTQMEPIINSTMGQPKKSDCRKFIKNWYDALQRKHQIGTSAMIQDYKEYLNNCISQHSYMGPIQNKILTIRGTRVSSNPLGLKESKLSQIVKNNLTEIVENKRNAIVETHIVKNRFKLIVESSNPKNKKRIYDRLISEIITLKSTGISDKVISEQLEGLFNMFKGLFGGDKAGSNIMGGIGGTFAEYGVQFLLRFIGLNPNSTVGRIFVTSIGNIGGFENIPKILTDCKFTSELLAKSIVEAMAGSFIDNNIGKGFLADSLRNVFTDVAFNTDMVKAIQSKISDKVCEALDSLDSKAQSVTQEIKQKALS